MIDHETTFRLMREHDVSFAQARVLVLLRRKPWVQSQLALEVRTSRPSICSLVTTLLEKKLIQEDEYSSAMKGRPITLTEAGHAMCLLLFGNPP